MSCKPAPPPKPSFTKIHTTPITTTNSSSSRADVKKQLFPSNETNTDTNTDTELNLLDEIYAEIEDKQAIKLAKSNLKSISVTKNTQSDCTSLSCSSSSYTSTSSTQSNACSCVSNYSSSSVASSSSSAYSSSQGSDKLENNHRPPLPSGPPPPLSNSNKTILPSPDTSLTLEQEIELELKMKRDSFCFKSPEEPTTNTIINIKDEEKLEEDEYLEPILLETTTELDSNKPAFENPDSTILSSNSESGYDEQKNSVNPYCVPYALTTSTPVKSSPKVTLTSPNRIKALFKINTTITPIKPVNTEPTTPKSSKKLSLQYYSGKITSTLRLMRSRSSTQDLTACNLTDEIDIRQSPTKTIAEPLILESWTLKRRKKSGKTVEQKLERSLQSQHQPEISGPTLISQTFDLSKQNLLPISQSVDQAGHISMSSFASSCSESVDLVDSVSNSSKKTLSFVGEELCCTNPDLNKPIGSNYSMNNISPTIAFDTIITNVYEEDGKNKLRFKNWSNFKVQKKFEFL